MKKKKLKKRGSCDTEEEEVEEPGPSSRLTTNKNKRAKKIIYASPLRKGEKGDIWTWPIYKSQLPVKCGLVEGMLQKDKLAKGEKCILADKQWFTPSEFEKLAGKGSYRNWKLSIRCMDTQLGKLIEVWMKRSGHVLERASKTSGNIGKSIRTDTGWMCPEEFTKEALSENYTSWRKDITYEGQPLSVLLKDVLQIHSVLCKCNICKPQPKDLDNENNDDQCCICQSDGQMLVECDHCPRSFHQNCHLPFVDDGTHKTHLAHHVLTVSHWIDTCPHPFVEELSRMSFKQSKHHSFSYGNQTNHLFQPLETNYINMTSLNHPTDTPSHKCSIISHSSGLKR
uniref:Nuclear body protein SP140-like n=1 Tax=Gouania willdenowi TaxID=441366 RepID=A0A8C5G456_GOUWI